MLRRLVPWLLGAALGAPAALRAQPGLLSTVRTVSMSATKPSGLTVTIVSGAVQTLPNIVDNAANNFPVPVRITTSWAVAPGTGSVRLIAYFTNPAQALMNGPAALTSARMFGRVQTAPVTPWQPTTFRAFTQNGTGGIGTNGGTLRLFRINITPANQNSNRTLDLELRLDLTGQAPINAGTWTGTINIRAVTV